MKTIMSTIVLAAMSAGAQNPTPGVANLALERPAEPTLNRVGISYRFGWSVRADFENLGGFPAQGQPGPATGGAVDRTYDHPDANYVKRDITGNDHGPGFENTTWYWGYENSQTSPDGWQLNFDSSSSPAGVASRDHRDDASSGFEFFYNRELFRNEGWRWGVEGVFGFGSIGIRDTRTLVADVNIIHDAYAVPPDPSNPSVPVTLPEAPYAGSFDGFGTGYVVIGATPTRTLSTIPGGASITGARQLDADLYGFRLGPYVEIPLNPKWTLLFSGGLALVDVESQFKFTETVTVPGVGSVSSSRKESASDLVVGGYAVCTLAYALDERWSLLTSLQYQNVGDKSQTVAGRRAVLDLGEMFFATVGVSYGF